MPYALRFGGLAQPIVAKTGNYTVVARDSGTLFTNRGAGAGITFTLPKIATSPVGLGLKGVVFEFYTVAAQTITISSNPSDSLIYHANATADTFVMPATIGQHVKVMSDGTGWLVVSDPSAASGATAVTAVTLTDT